MTETPEALAVKMLSLRRGDILVIQRSFSRSSADWTTILSKAAKVAGIDFEVPIVFVDDVDEVAVVRLSQ